MRRVVPCAERFGAPLEILVTLQRLVRVFDMNKIDPLPVFFDCYDCSRGLLRVRPIPQDWI